MELGFLSRRRGNLKQRTSNHDFLGTKCQISWGMYGVVFGVILGARRVLKGFMLDPFKGTDERKILRKIT
jgi:hypothetical protein